MRIIIRIEKDGKYYVAEDLVTQVADQGLTEEEAVANLKKGLEERYRLLMELSPPSQKTAYLDIGVEKYVKASSGAC